MQYFFAFDSVVNKGLRLVWFVEERKRLEEIRQARVSVEGRKKRRVLKGDKFVH